MIAWPASASLGEFRSIEGVGPKTAARLAGDLTILDVVREHRLDAAARV